MWGSKKRAKRRLVLLRSAQRNAFSDGFATGGRYVVETPDPWHAMPPAVVGVRLGQIGYDEAQVEYPDPDHPERTARLTGHERQIERAVRSTDWNVITDRAEKQAGHADA